MSGAFSYAQLESALWSRQGGRVHAVIDGSVVPGLPQRLRGADLPGWDCLKRGALSPAAAERAAYVVELAPGHAFSHWLLAEAGALHPGWGLVQLSGLSLLAMRELCRGLSDVITPDGERRAWRWYDPEVLQLVLPALTPSQLDEVFAAQQTIVCVDARQWTWYSLDQGVLASDVRTLMVVAK
jgi:hypothetical protein